MELFMVLPTTKSESDEWDLNPCTSLERAVSDTSRISSGKLDKIDKSRLLLILSDLHIPQRSFHKRSNFILSASSLAKLAGLMVSNMSRLPLRFTYSPPSTLCSSG